MEKEKQEVVISTEKDNSSESFDSKGLNSIYSKILNIMKNISCVKKEGKVEFKSTKYNYQKEEDITLAVREECIKNGLIIVPHNAEYLGNTGNITNIKIEYLIIDVNTGEKLKVAMCGQGMDSGDKGIYKAETGAFKYMQKQTFMLTSDESDPDAIPSGINEVKDGKSVMNIPDNYLDTVFTFGKHKGETLKSVVDNDKQYVVWIASKQGPFQAICQKAVEEFKL